MICDCCGEPVTEFSRVYAGRTRIEWHACAECTNKVMLLMPKETELPLLSVMGGGKSTGDLSYGKDKRVR